MAKEKSEFHPFKVTSTDGQHILILNDFDATADLFEEAGYDGGGYGWHGVADALVKMKAKKLKKKLNYDPEASMFVAYSDDLEALTQLAKLLKQAHDDHDLLREALAKADPDMMD